MGSGELPRVAVAREVREVERLAAEPRQHALEQHADALAARIGHPASRSEGSISIVRASATVAAASARSSTGRHGWPAPPPGSPPTALAAAAAASRRTVSIVPSCGWLTAR
ncbi:hypothetical protein O0235_00090 [Tepidiforma flava]|uniref:DUF222 domain-containing protein n=1 Tax=Tepidiforma flava TaxID=3004094 RepID=A0ABY7M8Q0_9CHLR|nr:hypothetical protein [Tepidiforma flava]WBL36071.1 hypothetical protein O0235_00090 [Tepidiforma flava]